MVKQITPDELADKLDSGESFTLVDTRPEDSYKAWHIAGAENVPFAPDDQLSADQLDEVNALVENRPVVSICGKGLSSTTFATELEEQGYDDVSVVKGGMEDWSKVYEVVPVETRSDDLVLYQVQRRAKGCLSYIVGSKRAGEAAVVDPTRQTDQYKILAEELGLRITHVLDTHVHADHISGGRALAAAVDAPYHLGEKAGERGVEYEHEPLADGDVVELGAVEIEALHAPGHTTEMMTYRVEGEALLTGDTLFVESVGRTELQFGEADSATGAEMLYETLHETILALPDEVTVLPGHVSVTDDGRYEVGAPGEPIAAPLAELRDELDVLRLDRDAFVKRLAENAPEKPPNYETVIGINLGRESVENESAATELELGPNNCAA